MRSEGHPKNYAHEYFFNVFKSLFSSNTLLLLFFYFIFQLFYDWLLTYHSTLTEELLEEVPVLVAIHKLLDILLSVICACV